jgi:large subunit ribosomal protein L6
MKADIVKEIELGDVKATLKDGVLNLEGAGGKLERNFVHPKLRMELKEGKVIISSSKASQREKTLLGTFQAHIRNMVKGAQEEYEYVVKICSGHFPMNVAVSGDELIIKNFLGENTPRKAKIIAGAKVKVEGDRIIINSSDKEVAGQMAARIENLCRITNRDKRIFQDGCYIISKAGKTL